MLVQELNIPEDLVNIIRNMYLESQGVLIKDTQGNKAFFKANKGVK